MYNVHEGVSSNESDLRINGKSVFRGFYITYYFRNRHLRRVIFNFLKLQQGASIARFCLSVCRIAGVVYSQTDMQQDLKD